MDRFFLPPEDWNGESLQLTGYEAHHCLRVMRKTAGDEVELFDGAGRWARGAITRAEDRGVTVRIEEEGCSAALIPRIVLCVAIPKGKTIELIAQKAVELGAAAIQPLVTARTVVRLGERDIAKKRDKWQRVALEACKQCGQNHLPVIEEPRLFGDWLANRSSEPAGLLASLAPGARDFREVVVGFESPPAEVEVLIGPEGDFSPGETEAALQAGFQAVTLGGAVLRVETAALYCLSVLRFSWLETG